MCAIIRPQRRPSSSPRRARSAISSATCRQSCAWQPAKRSSANWSSSERLRAYVEREPASSRLLSSLKGPKPIEIVENGELDWRCEFPLLDGDTLSSDLCQHSPTRLGCAIWSGDCCAARRRCSCCSLCARNDHCRFDALSQSA